MLFKNKYERKLFIVTILLRIFVLILIIILNEHMEKGFIASDIYVDDWRYEEGALYYSQHARSLFDTKIFTESFARLGDNTGYGMTLSRLFFHSTPFWYWTVCILIYITKTHWTIRVLNIIFAGFSSIYIYRFTEMTYGEKTARLTANLFALLPYTVFFSSFSYKDHLILLCTFYLLYISVKFRYRKKVSVIEKANSLLLLIVMMLTRSGLSIILLGLCICLAYFKNIKLKRIFCFKSQILVLILLGAVYFFQDPIMHKFNAYLSGNRSVQEAGNTISIVTITKIRDFYKLPLTYMFSVISPIGVAYFHNSWFSVVSNLNIIMVPISVGGIIYIFQKKKPDKLLFYMLMGYYAISIIMSTGIFRHYYSVLPLTFIPFSDFITRAKKVDFLFLIFGSILGIILILLYYGVIKI